MRQPGRSPGEIFLKTFILKILKHGEEKPNVYIDSFSNQVGNVYVKFKKEEDAEKAVNDLNNRWFGGRFVFNLS